jgi:hypothetical protein
MWKRSSKGGYVWLFILVIVAVLVFVFLTQTGSFSGSKSVIDKAKGYKFDPEEQEKSIDNLN